MANISAKAGAAQALLKKLLVKINKL